VIQFLSFVLFNLPLCTHHGFLATEPRNSVVPKSINKGNKKITELRTILQKKLDKNQKKDQTPQIDRLGSCNGIDIKHPNDHLVNFINILPVYQGHQGG
jgi:hypothetical protein